MSGDGAAQGEQSEVGGDALLCPRCLTPLEPDAEPSLVACPSCTGGRLASPLRFYVPRRGNSGARDYQCARCGDPVTDFSSALFTCPHCGTRHALPLSALEPALRATMLRPEARHELAGHARRFGTVLLVGLLAFVALMAIAFARSWLLGRGSR